MLSEMHRYLSGRKILILGFGREGRSTLRYLETQSEHIAPASITVADLKPQTDLPGDIRTVFGANYLEAIEGQDLVFKSPGISLRDYSIEHSAKGIFLKEFPGAEITGQMDLFLRFSPARKIGVSGTKGKSTTATLCYQILKHFTPKAYLIGNIGVPVFDHLTDLDHNTYCAVEMSSHQLEFCQASPEVAVLTNFYPEHLDHYRDYDSYLDAKLNLLRYQNAQSTAVLNASEEALMAKARPEVQGQLSLVIDSESEEFLPERDFRLYVLEDDRQFTDGEVKSELPLNPALLGRHVYLDALLAIAATAALGVPEDVQLEAIAQFAGIPHRLEPIGEVDGVRYYNDSIATIPQATLLALEALKRIGPVTTLLVGGMDRGLDYRDFAERLVETSLKDLICFPDTGRIIKELVGERLACHEVKQMYEAVALAKKITRPGEICLLSPAASSYNQYKNFEERGDLFREAVLTQEEIE